MNDTQLLDETAQELHSARGVNGEKHVLEAADLQPNGHVEAEPQSLLAALLFGNANVLPPCSQLSLQWVRRHVPAAQIEGAFALATAVFGDQDKAKRWLSEPNLATDNVPPLELLGDEAGFSRVKTLLMRIEYGVLA